MSKNNQRFRRLKRFYLRNLRNLLIKIFVGSGLSRLGEMLTTILSVNQVPIRLTEERWNHITEEHGELTNHRADILKTIVEPERVLAGSTGELLAIREIETGKWSVVVYRETGEDGFIITAFLTRRANSLNRRQQLWP